jgi:hypothetical protein
MPAYSLERVTIDGFRGLRNLRLEDLVPPQVLILAHPAEARAIPAQVVPTAASSASENNNSEGGGGLGAGTRASGPAPVD